MRLTPSGPISSDPCALLPDTYDFVQERAEKQAEPVGNDGVEHQHGRKHEIALQLARLVRHRVHNRGVNDRKEDLSKVVLCDRLAW